MSHTRGLVVGLFTVLVFGATVVMQAFLVEDQVPPLTAVGLRYAVSAVICLVILLARRASLAPVKGERVRALLLGGVAYALQAVLFYSALSHGTAGAVSLLFYTYPVVVLLLAVAFRMRPWAWSAAGAAALSVVGAGLLVITGRSIVIDGAGIAMALGSSVCAAGFMVANNRLLPRSSALASTVWVSAGVSISTLGIAVATGGFGSVNAHAWLWLVISGITTGLGTAGMYVALGSLGAPTTSVILSMQTIVATVGAAIFLSGQRILPGQIIGGAAILAAVAVAAYSNRRSARTDISRR